MLDWYELSFVCPTDILQRNKVPCYIKACKKIVNLSVSAVPRQTSHSDNSIFFYLAVDATEKNLVNNYFYTRLKLKKFITKIGLQILICIQGGWNGIHFYTFVALFCACFCIASANKSAHCLKQSPYLYENNFDYTFTNWFCIWD